MIKKIALLVLAVFCHQQSRAQVTVKKGVIIDSLKINDSISDTYALYLPKAFEMVGNWPIIYVFDMKGRGKQALGMFLNTAENSNYILVAPNNILDTLSITDNLIKTKQLIENSSAMFPINRSRIYTAGHQNNARFANLIPVFMKNVTGVISIGASVANVELLSNKNPFHFIGVVGTGDFNYTNLLQDEKVLNKLKMQNNVFLYEGGNEWPSSSMIDRAVSYFDLSAMAKGIMTKDSLLINQYYQAELSHINALQQNKQLIMAERAMTETVTGFRNLLNTDSLSNALRSLRKSKSYKGKQREEKAARFKEMLLRDDYIYYLEEDVLTYNFNNLGWWNYQMTQLDGYINGQNYANQQMGKRLLSFVNALVEDNIVLIKNAAVVDEEALAFLLMLKTITDPTNFENYLKVVSLAAKNNDFGTALYYLEEVLKKGYNDLDALYSLEHTVLFRITPEFNELVKKYLNDARYEIKDE
ncbi:MAG: alpha/beta hydrolase [Croceitalea sp.]|nr:alpha/beta hydrolase [Croceitalea sp.]